MKKIKRIVSAIMLILMLFNIVQPVFAASGTGRWSGGQYDSGMKTTDNQKVGVLIRRLNNLDTGERKTVFCAEHGVEFTTGASYNGIYYTPTDSLLRRACKIAYFGWYKNNGDYTIDGGILASDMIWVKWDYVFTQQYIWETLGQSSARFIKDDEQRGYEDFKVRIDNEINQKALRPSFNYETITISAGEVKTITDTNGVLADYHSIDVTQDGIRYQHSKGSNDFIISVDDNIDIESVTIADKTFESWGMIKDGTEDYDTTVYFEFAGGIQNQLYAMNYNDPVSLNIDLKIENYGRLELQKLNTNGDLIDGAVFNVTSPNGFNQDVVVTNGKIIIEKLKKGTYTITEKSAPYGYLIDTKVYSVEVKANETATKAIVNGEPTGTIQVIKKSEQGDLIKDTIFKVTADEDIKNVAGTKTYYTKGQLVANIKTDSNGLAEITNLPLGKYEIEEIEASNGYLLDSTKHKITISYKGQTEKIILESLEKIDSTPTGEIKVYKTDKYNNKLKGAEISLYARQDIKNVAGTKTWYKKGDLVATAITNEEGLAVFSDLHLGSYYVKEAKAPDGYLLNTKEFDAVLNYKDQITKVIYLDVNSIIDDEPTGTISLIKEDSQTGKVPQGNATFNKATYEISADEDIYNRAMSKKFYSKGDIVATRIMNEEGQTEDIIDLPLGRYKIREMKSPEGYLLDTKEYIVELKYKDPNTAIVTDSVLSKEIVKKMQIHILKSGIKTQSGVVQSLKDAEFTIKLASDVEKAYSLGYSYAEVWNGIDENGNKVEVDSDRVSKAQAIAPTYETIITDENGDGYTKELPYGKYIGKETKTPKDFETATDFYFSIPQDKSEISEIEKRIKHIYINNEQLETYIKLIKKDKDTGRIVTASSTTFKIRASEDIYDRGNGKLIYKKGDTITQKIGSTTYTTFTTNADNLVVPAESYSSINDEMGTVVTPLKLAVGNYEICEIKEPQGFLISQDIIKFKIDGIRDYDQDNDKDYILEIEIENEKPTGTLILEKSINLRGNIDKTLIDEIDFSKIKFKLTAKENILDKVDNSIIYKAGEEIGIYNLTKDGILKIENLPMGKYQIQEIETLEELVLTDEKYDVTFTQKDNTTKVYEEKINIGNETTIFEFSKTDITGDKELVGAKLKVIDETGNIIDTWISTEESHKIEGLIVGKEYTMIEEIAVGNYVKATPIKFKVINKAEIQKVTMIDKLVVVSKVDITTGEELEGALLRVLDEDNNVIDEWISTKDVYEVKGLEENKTYFLEELTAPYGYEMTERIEFKVSTDKETQKIVMKDKPIQKTEEMETPATGDYRPFVLWFAVIGISGLLLFDMLFYDKFKDKMNKKNKRKNK